MTLREDTDYYCLLWIGMLAMGAYYFSFIYHSIPRGSPPASLLDYAALALPFLLVGPPLMIVFFTGYLKPKRSRMKAVSLACAVAIAALYTVVSGYVPTEYTGGLLLPFWAIGTAVVVSGAISIARSSSENTKCEVLDTKSLKYPPESPPSPAGDD